MSARGTWLVVRAPFQVLVLPYRLEAGELIYAIFERADNGYWQGIAGGGEDEETPLAAAQREAREEAGITAEPDAFIALMATANIAASNFSAFADRDDLEVVPERSFGVHVDDPQLHLSAEHRAYRWLSYAEAYATLHWESNRAALEELNHHLLATSPSTSRHKGDGIRPAIRGTSRRRDHGNRAQGGPR